MHYLRQSTASQEVLLGPFLDDTDGKTAETGLTIANTDIKIWVEGGTTEASKNSGGATHIAGGRYYAVLDATDTATLGKMEVNVHVSGALPVRREFMVLPANVYDSLVLGTDYLQADAVEISGDSTAADNAELAFDGTGYGFSNCTMPTVTTLTGHTAQTGDSYALASGANGFAAIKGETAAILEDTGTTLDGIVDSILADTNELQADWANGGRLDLLIDSIVTYVDCLPETLNDLSAAEVNAEVDTAIETYHLDHLLAADYDPASKPGVATALLNELVESDGGVSRFTANALEESPSGSGTVDANVIQINGTSVAGTGTQVADAFEYFFDVATPAKTINDCGVAGSGLSAEDVWTYATRVLTAGTNLPTAAQIRTEIDSNSTQLAAIVEDTGTTLPATLATIDGIVDDILEDTGTTLDTLIKDIPTNAEFAAAFPTNFASLGINASGHVSRVVLCDTTTTNTDMRGTDSASTHSAADVKTAVEAAGSSIALILEDTGTTLPGTLSTIDGIVDSILEDTGTDIPATLSVISGYVDCLPATLDGSTLTSLPTVTLANGAHGGAAASITLSDYSDFQGAGASLTAADVADAVLDEAVADHLDAGSFGKHVADIYEDTGTTIPAAIALVGGSAGSGADEVTITWTAGGNPVADGDVWVTSDANGATVVAGTLQTNSNGQATFMLDAGSTYFLWAAKDGYNSIKGQRFVAVAD